MMEEVQIKGPQSFSFKLKIGGSKSIANRVAALGMLLSEEVELINAGKSKDVFIMAQFRDLDKTKTIDAGMAGTAFRFLTAVAACKGWKGEVTGHSRMFERPIAPLVEALTTLGAKIEYLGKEGFPPLRLKGNALSGGRVDVESNISSQFVSALMLIGPFLKGGLEIHLSGEPVSQPYIDLSQNILRDFGVDVSRKGNQIHIKEGIEPKNRYTIESDWSSAAYWFSALAFAKSGQIELTSFNQNSGQADAVLLSLSSALGIRADFVSEDRLRIAKSGLVHLPSEIHGKDFPDLVMALAVMATLNPHPVKFIGLDNLNLKESNRIEALASEIPKLGSEVKHGTDWIQVSPKNEIQEIPRINTYNDHRMALAFAPASIHFPGMRIEHPGVVDKSYPEFWSDLALAGFNLDFTGS